MAKKKAAKRKTPTEKPVDFESALADVEQIVGQLESGDLDLTEALQQYEQGVRQLKRCHAILSQAERRVTMLSGFDAEGNPVTEAMPQSGDTGENSSPEGSGEGENRQERGSSIDDAPGLF